MSDSAVRATFIIKQQALIDEANETDNSSQFAKTKKAFQFKLKRQSDTQWSCQYAA